jgi:hypothetical protein
VWGSRWKSSSLRGQLMDWAVVPVRELVIVGVALLLPLVIGAIADR